MTRRTLRIVSVLCLVGLLALPITAQTPAPIHAQVDRTSLSTDDVLMLSVTIDATNGTFPQFTLPPLEGFMVVGTSTASQTSIINGVTSANVVYSYRLQPLEAGDWTIPALSLNVGGQSYSTQPIQISVSQGTGVSTLDPTPAPGSTNDSSLLVEAAVDNPTPYVGEQVRYTFRFYRAITSLASPNYEPPDFAGFWANDETEQNEYMARAANGQTYRVIELSTILFPTIAGEITIEPATLDIPGSFFSRGTVLQSDPVTLDVQPLPTDAPADFTGAVGNYQISTTVDSDNATVGEPISLQVSISGEGNIETLPEPIWPESDQWRVFDSNTSSQVNVQNGLMTGTRTYERLMIPTQAGQLTIPELSYSYFDPATARYQTVSTADTVIAVAPGTGHTTTYTVDDNMQTVSSALTDISGLKPVPDILVSSPALLIKQPLYVLLLVVPLSVLMGDFFITLRQHHLDRNADRIRYSRAYKKARRALKRARRTRTDHDLAARRILIQYLEDKTQESVNGMTNQAIAQLLSLNGLSDDLVQRTLACLEETEYSRFGQVQVENGTKALHVTHSIIADIDKEFNQ